MKFAGLAVEALIAAACAQPTPTDSPSSLAQATATFDLPCPDGQSVSFAGSAPAGWFVASGATPSDPSIRYQILIGTAIR